MDRFDRYSIYLMSWGRGSAPPSPVWPPDPAFADAALASGIGVYQHAHGAPLLSIDGFDRCVAVLVDGESDDEPDVGPSARDKRELEDAQVRLRQLIAAGGVTDTGDRWLFDAAADEIVRLRGGADTREEREALRRDLSDALARLDFVRATLETPAGEMTERAAGRVMREQAALMAELRQAKEALEQARAKVDELRPRLETAERERDYNDRLAIKLRSELPAARYQGAAEMRERAQRCVDEMPDEDLAGYAVIHRGKAVDAISALPIDRAPMGAPGLTEDERAALRRRGWPEEPAIRAWRSPGDNGPLWYLDSPVHLRHLQSVAWSLMAEQSGLSAEDAETLRGAGWVETQPGHWRTPQGLTSYGEKLPAVLAMLRQCAAELRAKAPPVAHGEPGKATGGDHATGDTSSLAEEHGAAQGTSPAPGQDAAPHGGDRGQGLHVAELVDLVSALRKRVTSYDGGDRAPSPPARLLRELREAEQALAVARAPASVSPAATTKPARVEVGQRWKHSHDPHTWTVGEVDRHNDDMLATLHTDTGRVVRVVESWLTKGPHWTFLGGPSPQDPSPKRDAIQDVVDDINANLSGAETPDVLLPGEERVYGDPTPRGAYVVGPVTRIRSVRPDATWAAEVAKAGAESPARGVAERAEEPSEPTARDAVAGMLLRCGLPNTAEEFSDGALTPEEAARRIEEESDPPSPEERACIAALEALARGEIRVGPGHVSWNSLRTAIRRALGAGESESTEQAGERVARERNEARAAADMHINTISGALERLGAERHESLWHAADRVRCELDEANRTNVHLEEERRRNIAAVEHLMRSGDEARAEAAALWERIRELSALWTGLMRTSIGDRAEARDAATKAYHGGRIDVASLFVIVLCRMLGADAPAEAHGPCHAPPSCETTAEMRPAEDIAREMVSDARQSDFSMESRATLFGILVVPALQVDVDDLRRHLARLITRSRAEGLRASGRERVKAWPDNLPPEMAKVYEEIKDAGPKGRPLPVETAAQAEEPSGMRIEKRADGEWLVGSNEYSECEEYHGEDWCTRHFNGDHISAGDVDAAGAVKIIARWPIAPAQDEPGDVESSRVVIPAVDDLHMFSVDPASRVDLIVPKALDAHDVMRAVAELLGLDAPIDGAELEALRAKVNSMAGQLDDIGDVFGGEDGRNDPVRFAGARMDELRGLRSKYAEWQRMFGVAEPEKVTGTYAAMQRARGEGIEEGERRSLQARLEAERAAVQAELDAGKRVLAVHEKYLETVRDLVTRWRDAAAEANDKAHAASAKNDGIGVARFSAGGRAIEACAGDLRAAFAIEPTDPGEPPTGEPVPADMPPLSCQVHPSELDASCPRCDVATSAAPDREELGRAVSELIARWWESQSITAPPAWERLSKELRERNCRIGERLFAMGVQHARQSARVGDTIDATNADPIAARDAMIETLQRDLDSARLEAADWVSRFEQQSAKLRDLQAQRPAIPRLMPITQGPLHDLAFDVKNAINGALIAGDVNAWDLGVNIIGIVDAFLQSSGTAEQVVRFVPRLMPVTTGPVAQLVERIGDVFCEAMSEPSDGELRAMGYAMRVAKLVDEHLQSVAAS